MAQIIPKQYERLCGESLQQRDDKAKNSNTWNKLKSILGMMLLSSVVRVEFKEGGESPITNGLKS